MSATKPIRQDLYFEQPTGTPIGIKGAYLDGSNTFVEVSLQDSPIVGGYLANANIQTCFMMTSTIDNTNTVDGAILVNTPISTSVIDFSEVKNTVIRSSCTIEAQVTGLASPALSYNVPGDFSSLDECLTYLQTNRTYSHRVNINVDPSYDTEISLNGVNLPYVGISVNGHMDTAVNTVTTYTGVSGSSGNYSLSFSTALAHGLVAGNKIRISPSNATSKSGAYWCVAGVYSVASTPTTTTFTVVNKSRITAFPTLTCVVPSFEKHSTQPTPYTTPIYMTNCSMWGIYGAYTPALVLDGCDLFEVARITCIDSMQPTSITVKNSTIKNFQYVCDMNGGGIAFNNSNVGGVKEIAVVGSATGFSAYNNSKISVLTLSTGNVNSPIISFGNGNVGILIEDSSLYNIGETSDSAVFSRGNSVFDFRAKGDGYIKATGTPTASSTFSPSVNSLGNGRSFIRTL